MLVNLKDIRENKSLEINESLKVLNHHLNLKGFINLLNKKYEIKVKASAEGKLSCDYCLEEVIHMIAFEINEFLEIEEDEELDKFNLFPVISANMHEHLPMQILCKEDCKGLCKTCGINLNTNEKDCTCSNYNEDSPFASLRNMF